MAMFTVRVELHQATDFDYQHLHLAMESRGFKRTIVADNGSAWHLPPAEYDFRGYTTQNAVLDSAKAAISSIGKSGAVLVTEAIRRIWDGLQPAS